MGTGYSVVVLGKEKSVVVGNRNGADAVFTSSVPARGVS